MRFWLLLNPGEPSPSICYRLAEHCLCSDRPLAMLDPWRIDGASVSKPPVTDVFAPEGMPRYLESAWIGNRWRKVHFWQREQRLRLHIEAAGEWLIDLERLAVHKLSIAPVDPGLIAEIALGPGLILLLAQCDVFCLHASGVLIADRARLFSGDSGQGKSTLARADSWRRISDDITPVKVDQEGAWVFPHFPQLKLAAQDQYLTADPSRWPLHALYLLCPARGERNGTIAAVLLQPAEAARAIIAHTVASRLFTPRVLANHLAHAARLARLVPVYRLRYPWGMGNLPAVRSAISTS